MKVTPEALHYFRRCPLPIQQPKQKNMRTDRGENKISIEFTNYLIAKTLEDKCNAVWTKIAHETSTKTRTVKAKSGKVIKVSGFGNLMRNMGKNAGVADFIFTNQHYHLWLELKDGKDSKLSKDQEFFEDWCWKTACDYQVVHSLADAIDAVENRGICIK